MKRPGPGSLSLFFCGDWTLDRKVVQGDGRVSAVAAGRASFSVTGPDELLYHEEGHVTLQPGGRFSFFRSYRYRFAGEQLDVFFADGPDAGALYQSYVFNERCDRLELLALHHCGADVYAGAYEFSGADRFCLRTSVRGPKKDFSVVTFFGKADAADAANRADTDVRRNQV